MSLPRRGLVGATAVLAGAVMTITGLATGASATNGPHGWGDKGSQGQSGPAQGNPWQGAPSQAGYWQGAPQDTSGKASAAYVYRKRDASKPAAWTNSTQQYLVTTWPGGSYRDVTLAQVKAVLGTKGIELCGRGWAIQEDQAYGAESLYTGTPAPSYPTMTIGWPPIFAAQHWSLEKFFDVPACGEVAPAPTSTPSKPATPAVTPTATPSPVATPTAAPASTPSATPAATVAPTVQPSGSPTPSATPSGPTVSAVLAAPDSTQTASPAVVSAVLAAGEGNGALAQTGAAPVALGVVAVLLVVAGGVLLVLRRRGAMR